MRSFSNKKYFKVEKPLDRFTGYQKNHKHSNKYGTGMEIKETKTQFGSDKDGRRNCFTNIAVK
jgi:hypothetical protein